MTLHFTVAQRQQIAEMYLAGHSAKEVGIAFGVSRMTVRAWLIEDGVPIRDQKKAVKEWWDQRIDIPRGRQPRPSKAPRPKYDPALVERCRAINEARRTKNTPDAGSAGAAISTATSYREHSHRSMMEPAEATRDRNIPELDIAFWPTRRSWPGVAIEPPVVNCQRCGEGIAPTVGWWCSECDKVIWYIQQRELKSMVQVAHSGEYDPPLYEWIQDSAPWLIGVRIEAQRANDNAMRVEMVRGPQGNVPIADRAKAALVAKKRRHMDFKRLWENYIQTAKLRGGVA